MTRDLASLSAGVGGAISVRDAADRLQAAVDDLNRERYEQARAIALWRHRHDRVIRWACAAVSALTVTVVALAATLWVVVQ